MILILGSSRGHKRRQSSSDEEKICRGNVLGEL